MAKYEQAIQYGEVWTSCSIWRSMNKLFYMAKYEPAVLIWQRRLKHERTRRFTCSVTYILLSKYAPRLRCDDDTFTKPLGRTKADQVIRCIRRCEAHHMNSDLDGFNMSRLLDIHSPIDSMHVIILDFKAAHSCWLQYEYSWLSSAYLWWLKPYCWMTLPMSVV